MASGLACANDADAMKTKERVRGRVRCKVGDQTWTVELRKSGLTMRPYRSRTARVFGFQDILEGAEGQHLLPLS